MTKIAIYGDSFAADYEGWPKYFSELMGCEVTTFGRKGTSAGYSYLKFLETHEKYDIVYFLWTSHNRNWLISTQKKESLLQHHVSSFPITSLCPTQHEEDPIIAYFGENKEYPIIAHFDENDDRKKPHKDKLLTTWMKDQSKYSVKYPNKNLLSVLAMRDSVKLKRPESKNIECFDFFKVNKNKITSEGTPGMIRIQLQDMIQFSKTCLLEISKKRLNHLTATQNQEFAGYLFESFKTKEFDIHTTFRQPLKYYTMSQSLEESGFVL